MTSKKNNDNFDEILSSILDSTSEKNKQENREGIISEVPSYKDELEKYSPSDIESTSNIELINDEFI